MQSPIKKHINSRKNMWEKGRVICKISFLKEKDDGEWKPKHIPKVYEKM